jgi:uncharacterized protein (TIGR03083 family)
MHIDELFSAGRPPIITVGAPGTHGAGITGTHAPGVSTPSAAAVWAAVIGLARLRQRPNGMMLTNGLLSPMFAAGMPSIIVRATGMTTIDEGIIPKLQASIVPLVTGIGMTSERSVPRMGTPLEALQSSSARLRGIVGGLDAAQIAGPSYDTEWTVADVLSHLGSGAVIFTRAVSDVLAGDTTPDDFRTSVWDEWNAKSQGAKAAEGVAADRAFVDVLVTTDDDERQRFRLAMGPFDLDFDGFVRLRLNEHAVHTWDIEVIGDPTATVAAEAVDEIIDNLEFIVRFGGKPSADLGTVTVHTTSPDRDFALTLKPDGSSLAARPAGPDAQLTLPAEAFVRLVYGRLDPEHSPAISGSADLDALRAAFPGL